MRSLFVNLTLFSCSSLFFSIAAEAHPHKSGEIHHGSSLENYQVELDFSKENSVENGSALNIKAAGKDKYVAKITKNIRKSKNTLKKQVVKKQYKTQKK